MKQTAKIKMIKKNPCPYCDRAMNFFNGRGLEVEIVDLTNNLDELQTWKEKTGWQTVPMIFINDQLIGGYSDLKALEEEGKLDALLNS
ncbi:glutaredoxin domain-containing protein [Pseudobdellovibrio exovorus]|uniref:Glutaredoxin n=1 Tax=Pseudobdellovibrio exovorus JSS TaxID=1184267 RepID=M4VBI2_9BACT|nr:glutaredoxin domain-containing protein [Pseudobdellovibrio exovorus]AGH95845.1 glutaredoxin [Pseudobdellovibrio exovorus JSS]